MASEGRIGVEEDLKARPLGKEDLKSTKTKLLIDGKRFGDKATWHMRMQEILREQINLSFKIYFYLGVYLIKEKCVSKF